MEEKDPYNTIYFPLFCKYFKTPEISFFHSPVTESFQNPEKMF